ncbi:MAG: hypothetical protein ACLFUC_09625 [Bacteroidales bacterium]
MIKKQKQGKRKEEMESNSFKAVFKIEIHTLYDNDGKFCPSKMERLAMICTDLLNSGIAVLMVSSGSIALGAAKLGLKKQPSSFIEMQAIAAIGQAELISCYQNYFDEFNQIVAQVLVTKDIIESENRTRKARNTLFNLLERGIIPIINENDSVSTDDIQLNDNYPLVFNVSRVISADAIIVKSELEGKYMIIDSLGGDQVKVNEEELVNKMAQLKNIKENGNYKLIPFPEKFEELKFA